MDSFRTVLTPVPTSFTIGHRDPVLLIGSCFTEHIGERLAERKFPVLVNPSGIVYNPVSMAQNLERLLDGKHVYDATELFENQGLWHHWDHHGHFSKPDRDETLAGLNNAYHQAAAFLPHTKFLFVSLGTADVFRLRAKGQIVANNHKMPGTLFTQERLSVATIVNILQPVLEQLQIRQPDLRVILTVSPVRHLRAGAVENQRSKAALLLACAELSQILSFATYFPAYEILLDDLRDYRFYAPDMVHPNEVAIDYIWQFFSAQFFSKDTRALNERIEKILSAARHRPFNPQTAEHRTFAAAQIEAIEGLVREWPGLDFGAEYAHFEQFVARG